MLVAVNGNTGSNATLPNVVVTVGGVTATEIIHRDFGNGGGGGAGYVGWFRTPGLGSSITATVASDPTARLSAKVYIVTGHDPATPIGATAGARSTTNNLSTGYTSTVNNSRAFGAATDWNQRGLPTSSDMTGGSGPDAADYSGTISVLSGFKAADTTPASTAVTLNFDGGGTLATEWMHAEIEVLPATAAKSLVMQAKARRHALVRR